MENNENGPTGNLSIISLGLKLQWQELQSLLKIVYIGILMVKVSYLLTDGKLCYIWRKSLICKK